MAHVIVCMGLSGTYTVGPEPEDVVGMYLKHYDPDAFEGRGDVQWTPEPDEAHRYETWTDAFMAWKQQSSVRPLRVDFRPNRPLTAFSVTFEEID